MNRRTKITLCALLAVPGLVSAQSPAFNYQGRLNTAAGVPATGLYDFTFDLYAVVAGGSPLASTFATNAVPVTNGLFSVALDFSLGAFPGADRWLSLAVRTNGSGEFATLTPRQPLRSVPYAIRAASAGTAATAVTATTASSVAAGAVNSSALAPNAVDSSKIADGSIATNDLSFIVLSNTFWRLVGNAGTTPTTHFVGTTDGQPLRIQAPRVGINTTNPAGTLDLNTGAGSAIFRSEGAAPALVVSNSPNEGVLRFRHRLEIWPNPAASDFGTLDVRETNGAVAVRLPARGPGYFLNGPIGVGTNNPAASLAVSGTGGDGFPQLQVSQLDLAEFARVRFTPGGTYANRWDIGAKPDQFILFSGLFGREFLRADATAVAFGNNHVTINGGLVVDNDNNGTASLSTGLKFGGGTSGEGIVSQRGPGANQFDLEFVTGSQSRLTILGNGRVGVGTTAPQEPFHVAGRLVRVDGDGDERAYLGGDGIGGEVQLGSLNPAINNVLLWNLGNNTRMDLIANQITANQFNGAVSASSLNLGNSSTAGSVLIANDTLGRGAFNSDLRLLPGVGAEHRNLVAGRNNVVGANVSGAVIVGGGSALSPNQVTANWGTVAGGAGNLAGGQYSFAAGRRAKASHQGAFVWADSQNTDFTSSANNQFLIRALGGVGINSPNPAPGYSLDVNGLAQVREALVVDGNEFNNGTYPSLVLGSIFSGEGIGSSRAPGDNQYGIDFYTASTRRFSIGLGGGMNLHNNTVHLRGPGDSNHGLGFRSSFAGNAVDGPALFGYAGGVLGTKEGGENWSLRWNRDEVRVKVLTIEGGADVAEPFPMDDEAIEPGSVVVIDDERPGRLKLSEQAYDTRVAGIVSGAGGVKPGIALHQQGVMEGDKNVALSGRVYVKADAAFGAIRPGDLLTTSGHAGHAMKVADHARSQGAILGKAMSPLKEGSGLVLVLVTLQ